MSAAGEIIPLDIDTDNLRYRRLIGTGGIGWGRFFALNGNHTLGREESRSGRFLDRRDYCKLHIIAHNFQALMGHDFSTLPIGRVGDDQAGQRLMAEMAGAGLDLRYVEVAPGEQTMYSICLVYPDGSGGNITIDNSACTGVDAEFVRRAEVEFARCEGEGIALAAPEAPLQASGQLLELAGKYRFLRAASFTSGEILEAMKIGLLEQVDLLAMNVDEAATLTSARPDRP
ncbi:MAG: carbohydrate kinase family protein, partial [Planctomycetes bacterium]|nr:carbohydrate kinase family protein [Planctomycetota bacterium]